MLAIRRLKPVLWALVALGIAGVGLAGLPAGNKATAARADQVSPNIAEYVANHLDDFSATVHVVRYDDNAGRKISRDFGYAYKLKGDTHLQYKEENKLRLDGHLGISKATLIVNGTKQYVTIPGLGIKTTTDLGESPGKRKTLLDVGLISNGYLGYTEAQFLGAHPVDGVACAVFRVSYRNKSLDTSHRIIWVDPRTKVILKREEYSQVGKLNATYYYKNPREVAPGIWFPTQIQVFNNEGQEAAVTDYRDIRVNIGLSDDLFRV